MPLRTDDKKFFNFFLRIFLYKKPVASEFLALKSDQPRVLTPPAHKPFQSTSRSNRTEARDLSS